MVLKPLSCWGTEQCYELILGRHDLDLAVLAFSVILFTVKVVSGCQDVLPVNEKVRPLYNSIKFFLLVEPVKGEFADRFLELGLLSL